MIGATRRQRWDRGESIAPRGELADQPIRGLALLGPSNDLLRFGPILPR